jgi:SAM-dependent methyltransferase
MMSVYSFGHFPRQFRLAQTGQRCERNIASGCSQMQESGLFWLGTKLLTGKLFLPLVFARRLT